MIEYLYISIIRTIRFAKMHIYKSSGLKIGKNCFISHNAFIDPSFLHLIEIGNNVTITADVKILAHDASTKTHLSYTKIGKVEINDNVFIGIGSIILPNVTIGSNSIIGAGSVVSKSIPSNVIAAGNPAIVLSSLEKFLAKHETRLKALPHFEAEYTVTGSVTSKRKKEMDKMIGESGGYII